MQIRIDTHKIVQTRTDGDYEKDFSNTKFASRKQSSVNKDMPNHEVAVIS